MLFEAFLPLDHHGTVHAHAARPLRLTATLRAQKNDSTTARLPLPGRRALDDALQFTVLLLRDRELVDWTGHDNPLALPCYFV